MRFRKLAAGVLAAAMAVVSLPQAVSATSAAPEFGVGDNFYVPFDPDTGDVTGEPTTNEADGVGEKNAAYKCEVLSDGTIGVMTYCSGDENENIHSGKSITIPDTISGYTVTQIGKYSKSWDPANRCFGGFASITIPDTVMTISESAFSKALLEEIHFGVNSQLKLIDKSAFFGCSLLKSITIPASVETIGQSAFEGGADTVLETVKFAEGSKLKEMGSYVFWNQKALTSIELPNSVEEMGQSVFLDCTSLISVRLPESLEYLSHGAFAGCEALKSVTIPANVSSISAYAFSGASALEEVKFADNSKLKTIGDSAFSGSSALESITLPASVEEIKGHAFSKSALTNIYVDENNKTFKSIDGVVYSKDGKELVAAPTGRSRAFVIPEGVTNVKRYACVSACMTSLIIPASLETIEYGAFENASALEEVKFADNSKLKTIGGSAFSGSSALESITLPASVEEIEGYAFSRSGLTSITIPASVKKIDTTAFEGSKLKTIYGVEGSYAETFAKENGYAFNDEPAESSTFTDEETGVKVVDTNGAVPEGAVMTVRYDDSEIDYGSVSYLISFKYEGRDCELNGEVEIWLPVPDKFNEHLRDVKVYVKNGNRPYIDLYGEYRDGFMVFKTMGLARFYVVDTRAGEMVMPGGPDTSITVTDETTGISVSGAVPEGAQLNVAADTENSNATRYAYNIYLTKDGEEVQPSGTVTVKIPVPDELKDKAAELKVYHLVDGKYTDMKAELKDGYLVFKTDHFSVYVVTPDEIDDKGDDTTETEPAPVTKPSTSGDFFLPDTTTAAETTTAAAETTSATAVTTAVDTTTAAPVPEAPANTDNGSADTAQPVSTDNGASDNTADNGAANVGNTGDGGNKGQNPDTGSAIAIVPVIVAAAAVSLFAYKRKK